MSRKFFGLLVLSGMVLTLAGFSTQPKEAEAGFLFFNHHRGGHCGCASYDDDHCDYDDDDCGYRACGHGGFGGHCAPVTVCCVAAPAPVCCQPAPTCCAPAPTCCGAAPVYENGGYHGGAAPAPAPPADDAPPPPPEVDEAPAPETDA
jgi:hypothetical protein